MDASPRVLVFVIAVSLTVGFGSQDSGKGPIQSRVLKTEAKDLILVQEVLDGADAGTLRVEGVEDMLFGRRAVELAAAMVEPVGERLRAELPDE